MYEYSITFVHYQLYILLLIKSMFVFFFLFLFVFATFHGEINISKKSKNIITDIAPENVDVPRVYRLNVCLCVQHNINYQYFTKKLKGCANKFVLSTLYIFCRCVSSSVQLLLCYSEH